MGGGLMQLVAYGAQDVYISGNPQITFFKVVYRRHTNFSIEVIEHPLTNAGLNRRSSVTVLRNGDLATKMYLKATITTSVSDPDQKWAFVRKLGHALIKNVELEIGGSKIDKQYGVWMDIWYELSHEVGQEDGYNKMVGNTPLMTTKAAGNANRGDNNGFVVYIPLQFYFCRNTGLALPLIALQYHEVRVHFEFNSSSELVRYEVNNTRGFTSSPVTVTLSDASLLVDYVFLDSEERRRFAQVGHEYLIEQLQHTGDEQASDVNSKYRLSFNHPTKELVWAVRQGKFMGGKFLGETLTEAAKALVKANYVTVDEAVDDDIITTTVGGENGADQFIVINDGDGTGDDNHIAAVDDYTANGRVFFANNLGINASTTAGDVNYQVGGVNLMSLIDYSTTLVNSDGIITVTSVSHRLTQAQISVPVTDATDNRATLLTGATDGGLNADGVVVHAYGNYGEYLDGTRNPVASALIQLNGHDRFDRQDGDYFNFVQPWQHHTNTPPEGVNVYSFSLAPEQHQPQGTANLSRIDNTQLNVTYNSTATASGNKAYIFAFSYNVLRVMSGMGGLAYSN